MSTIKNPKLAKVRSHARDRRRAAKKRAGKCLTPRCRNRAREQRNFCCSCRTRAYYERNPLRRLWHNLKAHAKARGKAFALSWAWFVEAARASGYDVARGREGSALTVDRRDHRAGYVPGNVQFLTRAENSRKGWYERHGRPWEMAGGGGDNEPF